MSRFRLIALALLTMAVAPWLTGCSTLGIAKVDDLAAAETRLANQNTSTNAEIKITKQEIKRMEEWNAQQQVAMDSMSAEVAQVREWIKALNIDNIASDASTAKAAAAKGEERWMGILERMINNLRARQTTQAEELTYLEGLWNALQIQAETSGTAAKEEAPASGNDSGD